MNGNALANRTTSLPEGWSTPDEIALDLDCEISEVPKILAAAIRDGQVEKQNFPCWTPGSRQLLYQTGYRQRTGKVVSEKSPQVSDKTRAASAPDELTAAIHRVIARHPDKPLHRIVAYLPPRLRVGVTTAQVAAILSR
jgi:hypothetical protein